MFGLLNNFFVREVPEMLFHHFRFFWPKVSEISKKDLSYLTHTSAKDSLSLLFSFVHVADKISHRLVNLRHQHLHPLEQCQKNSYCWLFINIERFFWSSLKKIFLKQLRIVRSVIVLHSLSISKIAVRTDIIVIERF